jgi:hypothetical protein
MLLLVRVFRSSSSGLFPISVGEAPIFAQTETYFAVGAYHVDVNINTEDGVKAIDPVKEYLDQMPALRPLVLVLKELLVQRSFNSPATSGLGSYTLICMVISFLQVCMSHSLALSRRTNRIG